MAKTLAQIQAQIDSLKSEAERIRSAELSEVLARMKAEIATYGITAQQLFGRSVVAKGARKSGTSAAAYGDGQGNTWGGRGPRPLWLREALQAGHQLAEFRLSATPSRVGAPEAKAAPPKGRGAAKSAVKRPRTTRKAARTAKPRAAKSSPESAN